jgi:hypothetical protein
MRLSVTQPQSITQIPEPPLARFLFADPRMAIVWLLVRLSLCYEWLTAGLEKLTGRSFAFGSTFGQSSGSAWVFTGHDGGAIEGFVTSTLAKATGAHPVVQDWYAAFSRPLPHLVPRWHPLQCAPWDQTDATILLTALGVDLEGNKEVLALRACAEESKDGWMDLLQDLRSRGATQGDLIVTDGHDGLLAAVSTLFSATPRQRCVIHKQRNVLNAVPKRERSALHRIDGDLESSDQRGSTSPIGGLQRQISKALPRGRAQPDGRRRSPAHLLRLSTGDASLHPHHQRHRKLL